MSRRNQNKKRRGHKARGQRNHDDNSRKWQSEPGRATSRSSGGNEGRNQRLKHNHPRRDKEDFPPSRGQEKALETTAKQLENWLSAPGETVKDAIVSSATDALTGIVLDPWQAEAVAALREGRSVVVDAPTTAGKTRVVEAYFRTFMDEPGFRAAYTTPVKSLSNDKLREFRAMFGAENVGIATGDIKENLSAKIVVATLESYRNSLLGVEPDLGRTLVVFDEYHYIQDPGRGSAWEEAIILTPPACQILMLSASVANASEIAEWLEYLGDGRKASLVSTTKRPVPLEPLVYFQGQWLIPETIPKGAFHKLDRRRMELPIRHEDLIERLLPLPALGLTPCIIYSGRRLAVESIAELLVRALEPIPEAHAKKIGDVLTQVDKECGALKFIPRHLRHMLQVYGVGYHHSGLAAPARIGIESLVKDGLLRFCTATMGLSLGINFAVRSALISDYSRPGEGGITKYEPSEVLQMLGRAGRRGRDRVGFSLWPTVESFKKLGSPVREPVKSELRNDPTTFLGLVGRGYSLPQIEAFYAKSLRGFQFRGTDFALPTRSRVKKKVGAELPCNAPAAAYAAYTREEQSPCDTCPVLSQCHAYMKAKESQPLAALHLHLHRIGALDENDNVTPYGSVARYFPQAGGLLFARLLVDGKITPESLVKACEMAAMLAVGWFKAPGKERGYQPPLDEDDLYEQLEYFYPYELFPEVYDPPFGSRSDPVLREFNPDAAYALSAWSMGMEWDKLARIVVGEKFGIGDLMSLIYRVATYIQSIAQCPLTEFQQPARTLRDSLLRSPLDFVLTA